MPIWVSFTVSNEILLTTTALSMAEHDGCRVQGAPLSAMYLTFGQRPAVGRTGRGKGLGQRFCRFPNSNCRLLIHPKIYRNAIHVSTNGTGPPEDSSKRNSCFDAWYLRS